MNMTTSGAARRAAPPLPVLMNRVEKAIEVSGIPPTRFGVEARCGKNIVADIRAGRRWPRHNVRMRLLNHAEKLIEDARRKAFDLLMDQFQGNDIEAAVDGLIAMLDARDLPLVEDEPDFRPISDGLPGTPDDAEPDDEAKGDPSWSEWHTRGGRKLENGYEPVGRLDGINSTHEDDEDDDPDECLAADDRGGAVLRRGVKMGFAGDDRYLDPDSDRCLAGDDMVASGAVVSYPPLRGHPTSEEIARCEIGDADDAERWQATSNVPMPTTVSLEYDIFTDRRQPLGITNMMSSFRTNGEAIRSADSGATVKTEGRVEKPGAPV